MNEKYENSIKMLKYHKDPFQRKLMTKEEVDFLLQLQKEMNTQDSLGNADPRYWVMNSQVRMTIVTPWRMRINLSMIQNHLYHC